MTGLTIESLRAISTQANRELANARESLNTRSSTTGARYRKPTPQEKPTSRHARRWMLDTTGHSSRMLMRSTE